MALLAPIDRHTHLVLRAAVLQLRESEPRAHFAMRVHGGLPERCWAHVLEGDRPDAGQRAEIALALLHSSRGLSRPYAWLARPGDLSVEDDDLAWGSAFRWASGALGTATPFVVVTRRGWFDPVSGVRREWRRLRRHPSRRRD